jgi:hypothetical protein
MHDPNEEEEEDDDEDENSNDSIEEVEEKVPKPYDSIHVKGILIIINNTLEIIK